MLIPWTLYQSLLCKRRSLLLNTCDLHVHSYSPTNFNYCCFATSGRNCLFVILMKLQNQHPIRNMSTSYKHRQVRVICISYMFMCTRNFWISSKQNKKMYVHILISCLDSFTDLKPFWLLLYFQRFYTSFYKTAKIIVQILQT